MVIVTTMGGACNYALAFVLLLVVVCESQISDRRLCGDQECSEPVSYAKTLIRYNSNAEGILSFAPNENVKVYSKSAGSREDLWGVEIRGKRGYAPKGFLKEYKVIKKDLEYELPTEKIISSTGTQNSNVLHKNKSVTTTGTPQNEGSVSPKEPSESNSEHAPLFPSNEHASVEVSTGEEKTEDKPVPFHDGVTQPFELVDGTTIYLPSDEDSQAEPLPIQATMTAGLSSSVQVEAISTSVDSTPKLQPSSLSAQEAIMKSSVDNVPKLQPSTLSAQENVMKSSASSSSSPISAEAEQKLDEEQTLPETESETEGSSNLYSFISSWISEGSGSGEDKSVPEQVNSMESIEKPVKENLDTKEGKQTAANEDEKRAEDEAEDEEDEEDEDDYDDEYDDAEEEIESSQRTPDALLDKESKIEADYQNEKPLEYQTGYNMLPEKVAVEEGKLSETEKSKEVATKTTVSDSSVSDKSEYQKDGEVLVESLGGEKGLPYDGTKTEVQIEKEKQLFTNEGEKQEAGINAEQYHDDKATDQHSTLSAEELSGVQKESHGAEKVTSSPPEHPALSDYVREEGIMNTIDSINNIPEIKNEGTEESAKEMASSSSNNMDAQGNLSCTSSAEDLSTESTINDSDRVPFVGELESESSTIANETDSNERQEQFKHETEKVDESLSRNVQPETVVGDALPGEQLISSTENVSPVTQETESDYSVNEISTAPTDSSDTDVKENIKLEPEMISEEQYSSGLFSGITDSFWSSFGNLAHIFVDGSKEQFSDANVEEAQTLGERHDAARERMGDEAVSTQWSELQPSSDSFAKKEETQACTVDSKAAVGIDSDCDAIGALSRANKKTEIDSLKSEETDESFNMDMQKSFNTVLYLITTAITVLLFSLGHYYMEKKRRDGSLVAKINELEKALLVSSKECIILKDDLEATKEKLQSIENSSTDSTETVATLNIQLQEAKVANAALEDQVASLEKELEQATEAGLELNRMLTEFLSTQHGSESLMKSVEHLQKQLDSQQGTITTMTESLNVKNAENENLQTELKLASEKIHSLEEELQKVTEKLNIMETDKMKIIQESADKSKEFQNKIEEIKSSKEEEISLLHFELQAIQDSVLEMKDNLVTKDSEIAVLQDCIKQMKNYEDGDDTLQALLDVGETKAELKLMTLERNTLLEKLQIEEDARKLLEDHVKVIKEEVVRLRESYEEAEKEKTEAQTRLEVLSNYFKEKETQLQKELGLQEAMCLQREGDATSTHERIKSLQEEIENYKSQNEALKKEILDQERGLKSQISSLEKKAHENWIAARQAERKLEETKQEAGQLRNRLTVVEKNITNVSKNGETAIMNDRMPADSNGDIGTSPVHTGIATLADSSSSPLHYHDGLPSPPLPVMLSSQPMAPSSFMGMHPGVFIPPPPPPGAPFMPPPPPLFPGDRRPPPLGRMSSPPPPRRYSSPPPPPTESRSTFSPYEHSPPPSPLSSDRLYRSPPPPINDSPSRFKHTSPPPPLPHFSTRLPPHWDDPHGIPRSGFRPLPPPTHRDSPREQKGSNLSSGHSSESLEKSSRHSGRV